MGLARAAMWTALVLGALALVLFVAALVVGGWEALAFGIPAMLATLAAVLLAVVGLALGAFGPEPLPRWGIVLLALGVGGFGATTLAIAATEAASMPIWVFLVGGAALGLLGLAVRAWRRAAAR